MLLENFIKQIGGSRPAVAREHPGHLGFEHGFAVGLPEDRLIEDKPQAALFVHAQLDDEDIA